MHVIGTAGTEAGVALVREQGAHEVFNHKVSPPPPPSALTSCLISRSFTPASQDPDYLNHISGVNVCIEMLADQNLEADMKVLAPKSHQGVGDISQRS